MRLSIIILLAAITFGACKTSGTHANKIIKLKQNDGEYILLKKGKGEKGNIGDYILFSLLIKGNNGKTIVDRRDEASWAKEEIKAVDSTTIPVIEMLYSLSEGDSVKMYKPMEGDKRSPGLEGVDTLIYFIKAEQILDKAEMDKKIAEEKAKHDKELEKAKVVEAEIAKKVTGTLEEYKAGKLSSKLQKTENGVEYYINEKGSGPKVEKGNKVEVGYYGVLKEDGKMFDNSFGRAQDLPFTAGMGQMIKGWDEAMLYLHEGDKATVFIPYALAYGEAGRPPVIPAKADLVFYIEVHKVNK